MNDRMAYTRTAISLHWLVAVLVFAGWLLGWWAHDLPASPDKLRYFSWHKWIGVTVFLLALGRAGWRATHPPPPLPASVAPWQVTAANISHFLLYALLFVLPLTGWLMSSAGKRPLAWFGIPFPKLPVERGSPVAEFSHEGHEILGFVMLALVVLHVAAALRHHYWLRDGVLRRMW